jgi:hypothetical protein
VDISVNSWDMPGKKMGMIAIAPNSDNGTINFSIHDSYEYTGGAHNTILHTLLEHTGPKHCVIANWSIEL